MVSGNRKSNFTKNYWNFTIHKNKFTWILISRKIDLLKVFRQLPFLSQVTLKKQVHNLFSLSVNSWLCQMTLAFCLSWTLTGQGYSSGYKYQHISTSSLYVTLSNRLMDDCISILIPKLIENCSPEYAAHLAQVLIFQVSRPE